MYEINIANRLSKALVQFVTALASLLTDHRMSGLPMMPRTSISLHIVGPRHRLCVRCVPTLVIFSVAPAELRDSNIFLYCPIIVSFGLHSR